jgi:hypothetical protein
VRTGTPVACGTREASARGWCAWRFAWRWTECGPRGGARGAKQTGEEPKVKTEEQSQTKTPPEKATPVKLQIVFAEFDGEKKVKSLPYTLAATARGRMGNDIARLRIGNRVPLVGKDGGIQYQDVGTNTDCWSPMLTDDGTFHARLVLERSWVEGNVPVALERSVSGQPGNSSAQFREPIFRQFRSELDLTLRNGQSLESALATDPLSGQVIRVSVTLEVLK